jgi:CHAT domain-containing protein
VLVYLAGDTPSGHEAIRDDLDEILETGGSADLTLAVQHDGPDGATRYLVPAHPSPKLPPTQRLGRIDSGRPAALLDFLRWGITACRCERLALVLGSPFALSPNQHDNADPAKVLALTHDQGSGNYLDVSELAGVVREALSDTDRTEIDLLALDSCYVQFLEVAYELEDVVRVLIAPQSLVPLSGWDYGRVLTRWKQLAASPEPQAPRVAAALLDEILESYTRKGIAPAVSALDLERLDDVAHAFDALCISTIQVLGEDLIWRARELLLDEMHDAKEAPVYDCGSFFALWTAALEVLADGASELWLARTLSKKAGTKLDRFCEAMARHLEIAAVRAQGSSQAGDVRPVLDRLSSFLSALRARDPREAGEALVKDLSRDMKARMLLVRRGASQDACDGAQRTARTLDEVLRSAFRKTHRLLPEERLFDLRRMGDATENARRLATQSAQVNLALLGDAFGEVPGMVLAMRSRPDVSAGWPRWSGVSMYRPSRLDDLMNDSYQRFAFHRRVHWAAMLGAANLIEDHSRALWRLVSSLLATGSAVTRRDVLRRLSGQDSVIWGLRDQFQVMAPAPTLTLSLERGKFPRGESSRAGTTSDGYVLRLESITRGAVVTEQNSRVQPDTLNRALKELNHLLQQDVVTARALADLRAIGGLLGEDIFQSLGRSLEDERKSVRAESPDVTPHLQLQIPQELMRYPWELLHHHGEWLGERFAMGRQVFMETGLARRVPARQQGSIRPLIIGDPVFDPGINYRQLPGARNEAEQVAGWFERAARDVGSIIDFDRQRDSRIHTRLTSAEMRALLREGNDGYYDIVHFAGHGVFRNDDPETSAWLLSDGELWSLEIRNTLAEHPAPPWLVFANACEAGMDSARPARKYQENVFGLATAFINQGVAAYVAPLWPIDDRLAQHIALVFYQQLLSERTTLGEALRRAKASARELADSALTDARQQPEAVFAGLGWASLVLYGDPTEELFQGLAGGSHLAPDQRLTSSLQSEGTGVDRRMDVRTPGPARRDRARATPTSMPSVLHAPDRVVSNWVQGPTWRRASLGSRGPDQSAADGIVIELIEDAGLRRWRLHGGTGAGTRGAGGESDGLPGSRISALLADDRIRDLLPARRGGIRVVGRWVLTGMKDGVLGLVREYDREQVPTEGLLMANGTTSAQLVGAQRNGGGGTHETGPARRALLLVHGTFSKTASPVDGFGGDFMTWAKQHYRDVLGFDHWTLSKSPEENASQLADELRRFDADLLHNGSLDIISHSRGGLVARAFCELLGHADAVRNLIFLGTPNCGTDLANPKNWATFADLLVNMTGVDGAELFGRLAGLLAQLVAGGVLGDVPGLHAQSPEAAMEAGSFLNRLQNPATNRGSVRHGVICSEFEPMALVPNLKKLAKAAAASSLDASVDALFASANDLVVNTAYAWGIGCSPTEVASLPKFLSDSRVLVYTPPRSDFTPPKGVRTVTALGVHHCNLFSQPRGQEAIKTWLMER